MQIAIDPARLKQCRVFIATPAFGGQAYVAHWMCVLQLLLRLRDLGVTSTVHYLPNDSLVTRARNNLADMFMHYSWGKYDDDKDFMLWLDGDVLFTPEDVVRLLAIDRDMIAAPYSRKGLHMDRMAEAARLNWPSTRLTSVAGDPNVNYLMASALLTEPMPLLEAGTGFLLVKRKVYSMMQSQMPELHYKRTPDEANTYGRPNAVAYFQDGIDSESGTFISEDWFFCRNWRKLGGQIWGCMWMKTTHIGQYHYHMDMPAIAELLEATGGYLHGPTRGESNATPQVRTGTNAGSSDGNGSGRNGDDSIRDDIARVLAAITERETYEAAVAGGAGPLGS